MIRTIQLEQSNYWTQSANAPIVFAAVVSIGRTRAVTNVASGQKPADNRHIRV